MGEGLLVGVGIALLVEGDVVGADALVEGWEGGVIINNTVK